MSEKKEAQKVLKELESRFESLRQSLSLLHTSKPLHLKDVEPYILSSNPRLLDLILDPRDSEGFIRADLAQLSNQELWNAWLRPDPVVIPQCPPPPPSEFKEEGSGGVMEEKKSAGQQQQQAGEGALLLQEEEEEEEKTTASQSRGIYNDDEYVEEEEGILLNEAWAMSYEERMRLYKGWEERFRGHVRQELEQLVVKYEQASRHFRNLRVSR